MTTKLPACPTAEMLSAYGLGQLTETERAAVARHLEACPQCSRVLANGSGLADQQTGTKGDQETGKTVSLAPSSDPPGRPPTPQPLQLPPELANHPKFRILGELGRGAMSVVYKAEHRLMGKTVALKIITRALLADPETLERFYREVRAAARLDHANIVRALDADCAGDLHVLVMEFVEGVSLDQAVQMKGALPVPLACHYVCQAAQGLQHAHDQGMVHRDIKPGNLILTPAGQVKILDFGLARLAHEPDPKATGLTRRGDFLGTPDFVAPEQAMDASQADIRTDVYSLGCTLYYLLAGRPPFQEDTVVKQVMAHIDQEAPPLHQLRPEVPQALSAVVARMLAKDPAQRFQKPAEVGEALAPFCDSQRAAGLIPVDFEDDRDDRRDKPGSSSVSRNQATVLPGGKTQLVLRLPVPASSPGVSPRPTRPDQPGRSWLPRKTRRLIAAAVGAGLLVGALAVWAGSLFQGQTKPGSPDPDEPPGNASEPNPRKDLILTGHTAQVYSVAFSPDGKRIVSGGSDKTIKLWDAQTGSEIRTLQGHAAQVYSVAFSPDGKQIVSGSSDKTIKLWNAQTGSEIRTLQGHTDWVLSVAFHPDGKRIASGSWDNTVKVWNADSGGEPVTLKGHTSAVSSVAFRADGKQIVSGSWDNLVKVWNADTGSEILTFKGHTSGVSSVAFRADGKQIVSGSWDNTVKVWNAAGGKEFRTLLGHTGWVLSVAFSPDGQRIASGSLDNTVKVWETDQGREVLTLKGHTGWVRSVAFRPDGKQIVSGSEDKIIKVWEAGRIVNPSHQEGTD